MMIHNTYHVPQSNSLTCSVCSYCNVYRTFILLSRLSERAIRFGDEAGGSFHAVLVYIIHAVSSCFFF